MVAVMGLVMLGVFYTQVLNERRESYFQEQASWLFWFRTCRDNVCGGLDTLRRTNFVGGDYAWSGQSESGNYLYRCLHNWFCYSVFRDGILYRTIKIDT